MEKVTANQPFYGSREEGMWNAGDTKEVSPQRAKELKHLGLIGKPEKEDKADTLTKEDKPAEARKTKDAK